MVMVYHFSIPISLESLCQLVFIIAGRFSLRNQQLGFEFGGMFAYYDVIICTGHKLYRERHWHIVLICFILFLSFFCFSLRSDMLMVYHSSIQISLESVPAGFFFIAGRFSLRNQQLGFEFGGMFAYYDVIICTGHKLYRERHWHIVLICFILFLSFFCFSLRSDMLMVYHSSIQISL